MKMSRLLKTADFLTLGNAASGILAVFCFIMQKHAYGALFIFFAVFLDFVDGKVARFMLQKIKNIDNKKMKAGFGKQLDSLADLVSFGIAPSMLGFTLGLNSWYAIIILIFSALCALLRLARFNITKIKGYEGLPVTLHALVFAVLYFIVPFNNYILIVYFIMGLLMVSTIPIKKFEQLKN